eukprot:scaffold70131_cov41-Phaeocystis_antarctica.AAC.3
MSTKQEQETFELALAARDGFKSIKEELSKVDVRQVLRSAATTRTITRSCASSSIARAGRGLRRVQQAGHRLDAQGAGRPNEGSTCTAGQQLGPAVR